MPPKLAPAVTDARATKEAAEKAGHAARVAQEQTVKALRKAGLTVRDIGEILGISYQRVHQIGGTGSLDGAKGSKGGGGARRKRAPERKRTTPR